MCPLISSSEDQDISLDRLVKRLRKYQHQAENDVEDLEYSRATSVCSDIQKAAELLTQYSAEIQNLKHDLEQLNWQLAGVLDERDRMEKVAFHNVDTAEEIYYAKEELKIAHAELEKHQKQLKHISVTDALTGIYNRRYLIDVLSKIEKNPFKSVCFMMFDLDKFKDVNDTYGHDAGDAALKEFAAMCLNEIPEGVVFGRFGGEEFVLILPDLGLKESGLIAEKIRIRTEQMTIKSDHYNFSITVSIGLSQWLNTDSSIETLVKRADKAMYLAKGSGRNQVIER